MISKAHIRYDFTDYLCKVLYGDITPTGSLPGSISQNQKLHPARQHWLVEAYNEERDAHMLDKLINDIVIDSTPGQRSELAGATSSAITLHHPEILEAHFVVRNSSTQALYGFCSTYFFTATGTGCIGSLFVDPSRRKLSIGRSLHNRAIRTLLQRDGAKRFQLGSRLPSIFLGIPTGHNIDRKRLRSWFANMGWNTSLSRPVCSMVARNLADWSPPEGMAKSLQTAGAEFDLVSGWQYAGPILDHIKTSNRQGLAEVYKMALNDPAACGIIRAKRGEDQTIIGSIVLVGAAKTIVGHIKLTPIQVQSPLHTGTIYPCHRRANWRNFIASDFTFRCRLWCRLIWSSASRRQANQATRLQCLYPGLCRWRRKLRWSDSHGIFSGTRFR